MNEEDEWELLTDDEFISWNDILDDEDKTSIKIEKAFKKK